LVLVKLYATLRGFTGEKEISMKADTVEDVFSSLVSSYGEDFQKKLESATVLVNGQNIAHLKGRKTRLQDGDTVSLFPPLGGG